MSNPIDDAISTLKSGIADGSWDGNMPGSGAGEPDRQAFYSALAILESALRGEVLGRKCDCARGHLGDHRPACPEFPPEKVAASVAAKMGLNASRTEYILATGPRKAPIVAVPGEPTAQERITIAKARVERRKQELDNAVAEYAMACQTLAVAIERKERASEIPTEPANAKPQAST